MALQPHTTALQDVATQPRLFADDAVYDAISDAVRALGGPKVVGCMLWGMADPEGAGKKMDRCLNTSRAHEASITPDAEVRGNRSMTVAALKAEARLWPSLPYSGVWGWSRGSVRPTVTFSRGECRWLDSNQHVKIVGILPHLISFSQREAYRAQPATGSARVTTSPRVAWANLFLRGVRRVTNGSTLNLRRYKTEVFRACGRAAVSNSIKRRFGDIKIWLTPLS